MNSILYFMAAFVFKITASQNFSHSTLLGTEQSLTLRCVTDDLSKAILFKLGNNNKGGCIAVGSCDTIIIGYEKPTQQGTTITEMVITSCNETRDIGSWTCIYGGSTSEPVMITTCSEGTTNKPTDNDNSEGLVIGVVIGVIGVVLVLVLVPVVWMLKKKFFNNDASETSRSQRQQPDGHEGPQSTPKDPDARNLTTGRPLPRRPDIASPQTGPVDSVNSSKPNGLAPIENPNIPPSIDTLDEQKTDKKPKDKKKKKKKMKDEEQDNPDYVQDNNVLP